jgi:Transposase, Mutator family
LSVIRWGKQNNKQRFKCKDCGILFTNNSPEQRLANHFIWFKRWVLQKDTFEVLVKQSGYSKSKLQRIFRSYLSSPPTFIIHQKLRLYLIIDGTYFTEGLCLIIYYDSKLKYSLLYRFSSNEFYSEIKEDLENLKKLDIDIVAVTCDGKKSIIRAVEKIYPSATVQRCMVHVQRMVRLWLTRKPKLQSSKELRYLVGLLHHIRGIVEQHMWVIAFEQWYKRYQHIIGEKVLHKSTGRWWYKHRQLRRSAVMIKKALADMFHFIGDENIPKSTNGLDSYFGHLKLNLNVHRGLSKEHRQSFILWYLHLKASRH